MGLKKSLKNLGQFILHGVPKQEIYVQITTADYSSILSGKNILITGGSSGIGKAIAAKCISEGAYVCITGRDEEKLLQAKSELGNHCTILRMDMSDLESISSKFNEIIRLFKGKLDCVVSNAGIFYEKDFSDYTLSDWTEICNINLAGVYFLAQSVCDYFEKNNSGNLIFISSERGIMGDEHIYGITKAGVNNLTRGLSKKYAPKGIRINAVCPGMTVSNINHLNPEGNLYHELPHCKRILRAEEIAEVTLFLLSDVSKCINGELIACNEGNTVL